MAVVASKLPSSMASYTPQRYAGPANPVGNPGAVSRDRAPLSKDSPPTVMNPKLNGKPWSQSYAVHRTEPKTRKRGNRRERNAS